MTEERKELEFYFVRGNKIVASWEGDGERDEEIILVCKSENEAKAKLSRYRKIHLNMDSEHFQGVRQSTRDSWLY